MPVLPNRIQKSQYGGVNSTQQAGRTLPRRAPIILQRGPAQGLQHTNDRQVNTIQQSVMQSTQQAKSGPDATGNLLENTNLVLGPNILGHGMNQAYRGAHCQNLNTPFVSHVQSAAPPGSPAQVKKRLDETLLMVYVDEQLPIGQISGASDVTTVTITLTGLSSAINFFPGQIVLASASPSLGVAGQQRANSVTILSVNVSTGTLTATLPWNTITGAATLDFLFTASMVADVRVW